MALGRPREFDADEALAKALDVFCRNGYEGTSVADLTEAMGINRPSLYAAFGNKEALFQKALERYLADNFTRAQAALAEPDIRNAIERLLLSFVDAQTDPRHPPGCLAVSGALTCSEANEQVRQDLVRSRAQIEQWIRDRLDRADREGALPEGSTAEDLAMFVSTLSHGASVQAASGVSREDLHRLVKTALSFWPKGLAREEKPAKEPVPAGL